VKRAYTRKKKRGRDEGVGGETKLINHLEVEFFFKKKLSLVDHQMM